MEHRIACAVPNIRIVSSVQSGFSYFTSKSPSTFITVFFASGNDVSVISWTTLQKGQGKWLRRQDRSSEATHTEQTSFRQRVLTSWSTIFWHKPHMRSSSGTVTNGRKQEEERGDDLLCDGNVEHKILCY